MQGPGVDILRQRALRNRCFWESQRRREPDGGYGVWALEGWQMSFLPLTKQEKVLRMSTFDNLLFYFSFSGEEDMDISVVSTASAPAAIGPYSQGIRVGGMTFFSGQLGIDPATGKLAEGGVKAQAQQSLKNIAALLAAIDATPADIVKTTIYLVDIADFAAVNEVYGKFFDGAFPARSCVAVHQLPMGGLVEIEVIAVK